MQELRSNRQTKVQLSLNVLERSVHAQFGLQVRTRSRQALAPGAHVAVSSVIIGYSNKVSALGDVSQQNR